MNTPLTPALLFAVLCGTASVSAALPNNFLIVPGHRIGQTALGPNGAAELKRLPPPAAEDNGMMQTHNVWVSYRSGRTDTLYVHTVANAARGDTPVKPAGGVTIDTIRITSPQFHTRNNISTRSTLAEVRRRFPHARADHFHPQLYVDARRGIAFEFVPPIKRTSRCIAITVFPPAKEANQTPPTQSQINNLLKDGSAAGRQKS